MKPGEEEAWGGGSLGRRKPGKEEEAWVGRGRGQAYTTKSGRTFASANSLPIALSGRRMLGSFVNLSFSSTITRAILYAAVHLAFGCFTLYGVTSATTNLQICSLIQDMPTVLHSPKKSFENSMKWAYIWTKGIREMNDIFSRKCIS